MYAEESKVTCYSPCYSFFFFGCKFINIVGEGVCSNLELLNPSEHTFPSYFFLFCSPSQIEHNYVSLSPPFSPFFWEIASNFNCDSESQLGNLVEKEKINLIFFGLEGNTIPWCGKKV